MSCRLVPEAARRARPVLHGLLVPHLFLRHRACGRSTPTRPRPDARSFLEALDKELARLLREPLSPEEIEDAKSHLVGSMILSREDMETRMKRLVRQHLMMDRILDFDESVQRCATSRATPSTYTKQRLPRPDRLQPPRLREHGALAPAGFDFSFPPHGPRTKAVMQRGGARRLLHRRARCTSDYQSEGASARISARFSTRISSLRRESARWFPTGLRLQSPAGWRRRSAPARDSPRARHHGAELPRHHRQRLPRRGAGHPRQPRQRGVTDTSGDRIAQIVFCPVVRVAPSSVKRSSTDTARGSGGFGSTGV